MYQHLLGGYCFINTNSSSHFPRDLNFNECKIIFDSLVQNIYNFLIFRIFSLNIENSPKFILKKIEKMQSEMASMDILAMP